MGDKNDKQSKVNNSVTLSDFLNWLREVNPITATLKTR